MRVLLFAADSDTGIVKVLALAVMVWLSLCLLLQEIVCGEELGGKVTIAV